MNCKCYISFSFCMIPDALRCCDASDHGAVGAAVVRLLLLGERGVKHRAY